MSVVDRVFKVWNDLEQSYLDMGKGMTRREFLLKSIDYRPDGTTGLDTLKSILMKEYEGNEQKCDSLIKVFDAIAANVNAIPEEIEHLNAFVVGITVQHEAKSSSTVSEIPDDFLENLNPYRGSKSTYNGLSKNVLELGTLGDTFQFNDGKVVSSVVRSEVSDSFAVFKGTRSTVLGFMKNVKEGNVFQEIIATAFSMFNSQSEDLSCKVFIRDKDARIEDDRIKFKLSGLDLDLKMNRMWGVGQNRIVEAHYTGEVCDRMVVVIV